MRSSELTRTADRLAGTVAATLIGRMRRRRPMPLRPGRIVLIQPTAIGDTLLSSASILALAERFPDAELILAHGPSNAAAVRLLKAPVRPLSVRFAHPVRAARALRALAPDMVIDLCPWPYATAIAARLSSPWTAGFAPAANRRGRLFDLAVPHRTDRHESRNLAAMAEALGASPAPGMAIQRDSDALPAGLDPAGLVLCHISAGGARSAAKSWPAAYWAALMRSLAARGYRVGLTGAPADAPAVANILRQAALPRSQAFSLCGELSLPALAELLGEVALLVSVDTGVLHLSAAVEGRAIGLHGPTSAARWGSISPFAIGLDAPHFDAGYIHYGAEEHPSAHLIMETLTPERVIAAAEGMLGTKRAAA